jgi:hypothetical protein
MTQRSNRTSLSSRCLLICRLWPCRLDLCVQIRTLVISHSISGGAIRRQKPEQEAPFSPAVLSQAMAQALRSKKTMSAMRRMVPSRPPPMYIWISVSLSDGSIGARRELTGRDASAHRPCGNRWPISWAVRHQHPVRFAMEWEWTLTRRDRTGSPRLRNGFACAAASGGALSSSPIPRRAIVISGYVR